MLCLAMAISMPYAVAQELSKSFSKTFDVKADAEVDINNKYGQVNIQTWDKAQVAINVEVSVDARSEKDSQRVLDKIDVIINGTNSAVKAVTSFDGKLDCKNCNITIFYDVKMPAGNSLVLANEFGNADIGKLEGNTDISIAYGNLEIDELNGKSNSISLKFGDAEITSLKAAKLVLEYGSLELGQAGYLDLYSRFSGLEIGNVSELVLDSEYDGLELSSVAKMEGKAAFTGIEIGELSDRMVLASSYGGIEVDRVAGGFTLIDISTEFGGLELGVSSSASYKLSANASFGDISFPEKNADITKQVEKSFEKEVEAFIGSDKSSASVVRRKARNCDIDID